MSVLRKALKFEYSMYVLKECEMGVKRRGREE